MPLSTNTVYRVFVEKLGGANPSTFVGDEGEVFYNPEIGSLKLSDGTSLGGITITEPTSSILADNRWYVDPARTDINPATATGNSMNPFLSITAALVYIEARIADGSLVLSISGSLVQNPQFIIVKSSTTENVALTRGNIFICGDTPDAGHVPIWINGHVTITPADSSGNALNVNRFGLFNIAILPSGANNAVKITGSNSTKVYLQDTYCYQNNATKSCVYADNTGTGSRVELDDCTMARSSGSVYLIDIQRGFCSIKNLETNGTGQVLNQANNSTGTMLSSSLDANTGAVITLSGTTQWGMGEVILNNTSTAANTYGVSMSDTATMQFGVCTFNIPTAQATNRAINGGAGNTVFYANPIFQYGTTDKISSAISLNLLDTAFTAA
jgi:hypothetical protein